MASHTPPPACAEHAVSSGGGGEPQRSWSETVQRAQWLRAAILGANDGLLSTTSLMLGVGAVKEDRWSMLLSGASGAVSGAFSMAVGEYVSVSTQRDIEKTSTKETLPVSSTPGRSPFARAMASGEGAPPSLPLPNPGKAAAASGVSFFAGAAVPILASLMAKGYVVRLAALVVAATVALVVFGVVGARLGGSPVRASATRVLVGGWVAMVVTYLLLKPLDHDD